MPEIALIDYKMGNLSSVAKALEAAGAAVRLVSAPEETGAADALVLPGVGNFGDGMAQLTACGWADPIRAWVGADKPFLGICLGMQMLLESSAEAPGVAGLGIIAGTVPRFPEGREKVPHMGWNTIAPDPRCPYFAGLPAEAYFYFVHSYYVKPAESAFVAARTEYILPFASALWRGRLLATQFHPEKSQSNGLRLLRNFVSTFTTGASL